MAALATKSIASTVPAWLKPAEQAFAALEAWFDRAFGSVENPLHQLGALSFLFFWIASATGIYLYAFFDTSVNGAYASVERLTREQWYLGGITRSLHRYASDAFVLTMVIHLLREFVKGRWHGFRWFSWLTGVPLIWLVYASGLGGYWLVWDELAQFSVIATAEWLDWLPIFGEPIVHNFIGRSATTDRFFSLLIFLHIGIPLLLLLGMWVHIYRLSHARSNPTRRLGSTVFAGLLVLSLVKPATSMGPADLDAVAPVLAIDWVYMFAHPLMYATSPAGLWLLSAGFTFLISILPLLPHPPAPGRATVNLDFCNGCSRCFDDCPYVAITMVPRSDGAPHPREALVNPEMCAGCGICAGSCPSSTPFRTQKELRTGIDLPGNAIDGLRAKLEAELKDLQGRYPLVVFGCDHSYPVATLRTAEIATISLPCAGMLPPAFVDYALKNGAAGVFITGCAAGDCNFRLGNQWLAERLAGKREPRLRAAVERARVHLGWYAAHQGAELSSALAAFRSGLVAVGIAPSLAPKYWNRRKAEEKSL